MKHWNLGNTTVRNPDRIASGLQVLKRSFEDKIWDEVVQKKFFEKLLREKIIEASNDIDDQSKGISGRKWASVYNQLGFAIALKTKGRVKITDAGNALIQSPNMEDEIFLRQFLKYHLPSQIEQGKDYLGFNVNPYYVVLRLLFELSEQGIDGLTKDEIGFFVITCIRNQDIPIQKEKIISYRNLYSKIVGKSKKREFYRKKKIELISSLYDEEIKARIIIVKQLYEMYIKNTKSFNSKDAQLLLDNIVAGGKGSKTKKALDLKKVIISNIRAGNLKLIYDAILEMYINTKGNTLNDYADTTVRYSIKTGLLSIKGNRLIIKEDKLLFVKELINNFEVIIEDKYLTEFYSSSSPQLPSDNVSFLHENLLMLQEHRSALQKTLKLPTEKIKDSSAISNTNQLKSIQRVIELQNQSLKEILFYRKQAEEIDDILDFFEQIADKTLLGGDAYLPAYLEWTTWRAFLAIDNIFNEISKTRNFNIDEELNPIHHAKSGEPDMVFEYSDFVIVCEVTLRNTENQWSEEEPVPRHIANIMKIHKQKEVYGVFLAPSIDPNTCIEFHQKKRLIDGKLKKVKIVPLTIDQFKQILIKFDKKRFSTEDLKLFLTDLINLQEKTDNPIEWQKFLSDRVNTWICE